MPHPALLALALAALPLLPLPLPAAAATPVEVVQADLDALNANDLDAFMALYGPQAQIFGLPKDPRVLTGPRLEQMQGHDKLRAVFAKAMAEPVTPKIHATESIALGDLVVARVRIDDPRQPEPTVMMVAYRVQDGLIQELWHLLKEDAGNRGRGADALATAQALAEANNRADADAFLARFAPDARHHRLPADPARLDGELSAQIVDAASRERSYRALYAQGAGLQVRTLAAFAVGDLVAVHERIDDAAKPGQTKELISVLRVRDGRVLDLWPLQRRIVPAGAAQAAR